VLRHTVLFLVRGSYLKVNCIDAVLDDFLEFYSDERRVLSDSELNLLGEMRHDSSVFERVVNEAEAEELGYMVALMTHPYIERERGKVS